MNKRFCVARRGDSTFVVAFDAGDHEPALRAIGAWANNPELDFSSGDGFRMMTTILQFAPRQPISEPPPPPPPIQRLPRP